MDVQKQGVGRGLNVLTLTASSGPVPLRGSGLSGPFKKVVSIKGVSEEINSYPYRGRGYHGGSGLYTYTCKDILATSCPLAVPGLQGQGLEVVFMYL